MWWLLKYPWHATYNFRLFFSYNYDGKENLILGLPWSNRGNFSTFSVNFDGTYERGLVISVFFPSQKKGNNKNQFWTLCGKIWPPLLNLPLSFVLGSVCLLQLGVVLLHIQSQFLCILRFSIFLIRVSWTYWDIFGETCVQMPKKMRFQKKCCSLLKYCCHT